MHFSPIAVTVSASPPYLYPKKPSASAGVFTMISPGAPNKDQLYSFLTGVSFQVNGTTNWYIGMTVQTNQNFSMWSYGVGPSSPGVSGSAGFQPDFLIMNGGKKWGPQ